MPAERPNARGGAVPIPFGKAVERSVTGDAQRWLRSVGFKSIGPRAWAIEALLRTEEPPSHRQFVQDPACRGFDGVSVYRAFVEKGSAHRLVAKDRVGRFAASSRVRSHPRHSHSHCRLCVKLERPTWIQMPTLALCRIGLQVERQSLESSKASAGHACRRKRVSLPRSLPAASQRAVDGIF